MSANSSTVIPSMPTGKTPKERTRKIATKEICPEGNESLAALGMSPFMPGLDAISNQNRLVRNESILARHVLRLQTSFSTSETRRAQREQDIYRTLTEHNVSIGKLSRDIDDDPPSCPTILSNPDFVAHVQAHVETRNALNALIAKVSALTAANKKSIAELKKIISELSPYLPVQHHRSIEQASGSPSPNPSPNSSQVGEQTPSENSDFPSINLLLGIKRKREISDLAYRTDKRGDLTPRTVIRHQMTTGPERILRNIDSA